MRILKLIAVFTSVVLITTSSQARDELFPFIAKVIKDDVNVRSGQSTNFESLGRLSIDSEVVVFDKKYSWYKIKLPPNFNLYISEEFVFVKPDKTGDVLGNRINVRAKPSAEATVVAQVSKGDKLEVVEVRDGWCKIKPLESVYGWIGEDFLKYESKAVDSFVAKPILSPDEKLAIEKKQKEEQDRLLQQEKLRKEQEEARRKISAKGKIRKITSGDTQGHYQLITTNQLIYLIDEPAGVFDKFDNLYVTIEGKITSFANVDVPHPIIKVNKIQLVL